MLLAEQAAVSRDDCVVCLGPRPNLRIVPASIESQHIMEVMNNTFFRNKSLKFYDKLFPVVPPTLRKSIFHKTVTKQNFTCLNFIGGSVTNLGSVPPDFCVRTLQADLSFRSQSCADVWWWCGEA